MKSAEAARWRLSLFGPAPHLHRTTRQLNSTTQEHYLAFLPQAERLKSAEAERWRLSLYGSAPYLGPGASQPPLRAHSYLAGHQASSGYLGGRQVPNGHLGGHVGGYHLPLAPERYGVAGGGAAGYGAMWSMVAGGLSAGDGLRLRGPTVSLCGTHRV